MKLAREDLDILRGKLGAGAARGMEILAALGRIHEARDMVLVESAQVSGVSYDNIGEHGLAFLEEWASQGSRAVVPATMNPGGADRRLWKSLGFNPAFVRKQERVIAALERLGIRPTLTCTPYHLGLPPRPGSHLAWAESSAVCFANSVLGARTNREGGPPRSQRPSREERRGIPCTWTKGASPRGSFRSNAPSRRARTRGRSDI